MKLSLPPKLVEKLSWVPLISFCKISFPVTHLMSYYAKTSRSRLAWLYITENFYILWLDNNNDLPTLDEFCKLQLHAQKWDTNTVPTDYLQVCLVDPCQCCVIIWNFQRTIDFIDCKYQRTFCSGWLFVFSKKICEPWLCKNWVFDVLRSMVMQELGLWCFKNHDNHQGFVPVSDNHSTPVPTRCWLEFFWPK
jgi:hypothetical protein